MQYKKSLNWRTWFQIKGELVKRRMKEEKNELLWGKLKIHERGARRVSRLPHWKINGGGRVSAKCWGKECSALNSIPSQTKPNWTTEYKHFLIHKSQHVFLELCLLGKEGWSRGSNIERYRRKFSRLIIERRPGNKNLYYRSSEKPRRKQQMAGFQGDISTE